MYLNVIFVDQTLVATMKLLKQNEALLFSTSLIKLSTTFIRNSIAFLSPLKSPFQEPLGDNRSYEVDVRTPKITHSLQLFTKLSFSPLTFIIFALNSPFP